MGPAKDDFLLPPPDDLCCCGRVQRPSSIHTVTAISAAYAVITCHRSCMVFQLLLRISLAKPFNFSLCNVRPKCCKPSMMQFISCLTIAVDALPLFVLKEKKLYTQVYKLITKLQGISLQSQKSQKSLRRRSHETRNSQAREVERESSREIETERWRQTKRIKGTKLEIRHG